MIKKKKQITNFASVESLLEENEEILLQIKPNMSNIEFLKSRPPIKLPLFIGLVLLPFILSLPFLGVWLMGKLFTMLAANLFPAFDHDLIICVSSISGWILGFVAMYVVGELLGFLWTLVLLVREKPHIIYTLTARRIFFTTNRIGFSMRYRELSEVTVKNSKYGYALIWEHQRFRFSRVNNSDHFPPFIGLNDFDVQQILDLIKPNGTPIHDAR